ncbi:MAG: RNA-binding protein, partial [Papillibacter sp.]|nr:RNA-binding protein [Papillibacter sp.]
MKELLLYIAQNLVDNPDKVTVNEREEEDGEIVLELRVA